MVCRCVIDGVPESHATRKVDVNRPVAHFDTFAKHMTAEAKKLEEDEETGTKELRYIKTGGNHFGVAFTYSLLAGEGISGLYWLVCVGG